MSELKKKYLTWLLIYLCQNLVLVFGVDRFPCNKLFILAYICICWQSLVTCSNTGIYCDYIIGLLMNPYSFSYWPMRAPGTVEYVGSVSWVDGVKGP